MNENAIQEKMNYCLNCKIKPCSNKGCPLGNDIPTFIKFAKEGKIEDAYTTISKTSVLPGICGRVCPHKKQCEGSCVRGIRGDSVDIGTIESYIFDKAMEQGLSLKKIYEKNCEQDNEKREILKGKKVAIIGGGPAGLVYGVTIFEKYNSLGGILVHGIPEFRLNTKVVEESIKNILDLGVDVKYNKELGKDFKLEELKKDYDAIFLATGANRSAKMGVEGENLKGVYGGNELLEKNIHPEYQGKVVAVIGGGNVAMDCARTIQSKGAKEVFVIYRRAEAQMPAEQKEIQDAKKEGVNFLFQNNIVKILGNDRVEGLELIKTDLVKKEGETREVPVNIDGSNYIIDVDYVVMALGGIVSDEMLTLGLTVNKWGNILVDEQYHTSDIKIFAGGDLAGTKGTVAWAARSGREAAKCIKNFLSENC